MATFVGKRLLDLLITIPLLALFSPLLLILGLLVRLKLGAPVFFRQQRPGLHGKPFLIYKLRTMTDAHDAVGNLLPDAQRLTPFGQFLRSSSLDELPELFNVLRGEMSLVGPRPLLMQYLPRYTPEQMRRHEVLPGITGWAQINGRNAISWEKKFDLDLWYVEHSNLWVDLMILFRTIMRVLHRGDINQAGEATVQPFLGSQLALLQARSEPGQASLIGANPAPRHTTVAPAMVTPDVRPPARVLIVGAGGHAQVVADILLRAQETGEQYVPIGYLDDDPALHGLQRLGLPILGGIQEIGKFPHDAVVVAIGNNATRRKLFERLQSQGEQLIAACHPTAIIAPDVTIGPGSVIGARVVVNPGSSVGMNVILNTACTVDHHNHIGDHVHIAPGVHLGGDVTVGEETLVGLGANVMPQCTIGARSTVGAGTLVNRNVPDKATVVGVPARLLIHTATDGGRTRRAAPTLRQPPRVEQVLEPTT